MEALLAAVLLFLCVVLYSVGARRLYVALVTLPRDIRLIYKFKKLAYKCASYKKNNDTIVSLFALQLKSNPDKPCFYYLDQVWTYSEVENYSNQIAHVFLEAGYRKGDVIALCMKNCPEYICIWLGLAKIGVITALVNINIRGQSLAHSLKVAEAIAIIYGEDMSQAVTEIDCSIEKYQLGGSLCECFTTNNLTSMLLTASKLPVQVKNPGFNDDFAYIYTSGTTGLPKAAIIHHSRFIIMTLAATIMCNLKSDDILYNPLPLYHTAGGVIGTGQALMCGISTVIKTKFSASSYFPDCIKYKCTAGQYIGEICRYILATPPSESDTKHSIRVMVGNGLRPKIWKSFVERFKIPQICEIYGATEGNSNIVNIDNVMGAVGRLPRCMPLSLLPMGLIKMDKVTGEPLRNSDGLCIRSDTDEPGLFVGIINEEDSFREFNGYVDKEASKKKILENVFKKGDKAFSSGDVLVMDEYGHLYFKERIGETFRWKGENISTAEVENLISNALGLRELAVYGVQVPETEGKAGMVAIADSDGTLDLQDLVKKIDGSVPFYARPLFVRLVDNLDKTGTFKIKKVRLQEEGFDPTVLKDRLYFRSDKGYVPLTPELYENIVQGKVRL